MKKLFTIAIVLFINMAFVNAQDSLMQTFAKSYQYEKSEQYAQAISTLKEMYSEKHYELNLRIGYLHYLLGQHIESVKYYTKAVELKPNCVQAKLGLVYPNAAQKKWDIVIKLYEDILKIAPTTSYVSYKLGLIHYERKNYQTALSYFELVYNLYPFDYEGLLMMGWTNLQLGKKAEANYFFNKTLLIAPNDKSALEGLQLLK